MGALGQGGSDSVPKYSLALFMEHVQRIPVQVYIYIWNGGMHVTVVPEYPHVDIYSFIEAAGRAEVCVDDVEDAAAVRVVNYDVMSRQPVCNIEDIECRLVLGHMS